MHLEAEVTDEARKMPHETLHIIHSIIIEIEYQLQLKAECQLLRRIDTQKAKLCSQESSA